MSFGNVRTGFILILLLSFFASFAQQKVGLVLSGGAAKGIAHIGVLKALEENEIPIDYIVGTSMGGIVGGCYAAGMSPAQIEEIMTSQAFLDWVSGRIEEKNKYFYYKKDDEPSFLKLNLSLDSTFNVLFNTSIANDLSLNFALTQTLAQPASVSKNNFDSLFVPLRIMAADIFTQTQVELKEGVLSDALRATQTAPFFFNPIRINGKYLFDGGVYNNFPVDVLQRDFKPDVIIGSNVSSKVYDQYPFDEDEKMISRSLLYMLLDKSDPGKIPKNGVYIQPNLKNFTAFDFSRAKAMIDSGYRQTLKQMEEIKAKVNRRITCEAVAQSRNHFNNKSSPIKVNEITYEGFDRGQQKYLNRFFKNGKRPLYYHDVEKGYFQLVSEEYFNNIYPSFKFNPTSKDYNFRLARRQPNNFQVDFGGVIATRNISNVYLGLNYYSFSKVLTHAQINIATGDFYKSLQLRTRFDFPILGRFYIEPEATFNNWNFFQGNDILARRFSPTVLTRVDRKYGASLGIPVARQIKANIYGAYVVNHDQFIDKNVLVSTDTLDQLVLSGTRFGLSILYNTLDRKQYPTQGKSFSISANYFSLLEEYQPGNTSVNLLSNRSNRSWLQGKISLEQYFKKGLFSSGYLLEGVFSNQPTFTNYFGTIINAPAFNPLQDSRTLLLQNFRAFNYVAGGLRNIFSLRKKLDLRLEAYAFKPLQAIAEDGTQHAKIEQQIQQLYFAGMADLVFHSTVGPVSLSLNYYDDRNRQLAVLLHVGFLLFNKTSLE
ncbi:MAG: patatin-like phospholipase family protein [Bacteroidetes bacterium]|nr:patatin-like phospholipase family protein [Bacteroidota bacterium]